MQAIYPTMVIALVNSHHTFDRMYLKNASLPTISQGIGAGHTTTIRFAEANPATSTGPLPELVQKSGDSGFPGSHMA